MAKYNPKIMELLHKQQEKAGIRYSKVGEAPYNAVRVLFYIAFAYNLVINLLYLLATFDDYSSKSLLIDQPSNAQMIEITTVKNSLSTVAVLCCAMIISVVFLALKKHTVLVVFTLISSVSLSVHFYQRMSKDIELNGISPYFFRHALPLILYFLFGSILFYISVSHRRHEKKAYDKLVDAVYAKYSEQFLDLKEEQWESFLSTYEPEVPQRLQKRLDKKRNRKNKKGEARD